MEQPVVFNETDVTAATNRRKVAYGLTVSSSLIVTIAACLFSFYLIFVHVDVQQIYSEISKVEDEVRPASDIASSLLHVLNQTNELVSTVDLTVTGFTNQAIPSVKQDMGTLLNEISVMTQEIQDIKAGQVSMSNEIPVISTTLTSLETSNTDATSVLNGLSYLNTLSQTISNTVSSILQASNIWVLYQQVSSYTINLQPVIDAINSAVSLNQQSEQIVAEVQAIPIFQASNTITLPNNGYICIGSLSPPNPGSTAMATGTFALDVEGIRTLMYTYVEWDGTAPVRTSTHRFLGIELIYPLASTLNVADTGTGMYISSALISADPTFQAGDNDLHVCVSGVGDGTSHTVTINQYVGNSWTPEARVVPISEGMPSDISGIAVSSAYLTNAFPPAQCIPFTIPCTYESAPPPNMFTGHTATDAISACALLAITRNVASFVVFSEPLQEGQTLPTYSCHMILSPVSAITSSSSCVPSGVGMSSGDNFLTTSAQTCGTNTYALAYSLV